MEKKISFGFSKITKKNEIVAKPPSNKVKQVEYIECLDEKAIKVKNEIEEKPKNGPLVIPLNNTKKSILDRIIEARKANGDNQEKEDEQKTPNQELTVDELAVQELINDAKQRKTEGSNTKVTTLPQSDGKFEADGADESNLHDYESVPISDYGMAMLRGMGWKEGTAIGKNSTNAAVPILPELRAKGLGLGADKIVHMQDNVGKKDKDGKDLKLVKGAFAKIIAGAHKGNYCQVEGLDDDNCRVIVKKANTHEILSLNEFLVIPITKEEYGKESRVINHAKYEEYKEESDKKLGRSSKCENRSISRERHRGNSNRKHRSSSRERRRSKSKDKDHSRKHRSRSRDSKHRHKSSKHKSRRN